MSFSDSLSQSVLGDIEWGLAREATSHGPAHCLLPPCVVLCTHTQSQVHVCERACTHTHTHHVPPLSTIPHSLPPSLVNCWQRKEADRPTAVPCAAPKHLGMKMRCSFQIRVSHGKAQTTPDLGAGGPCLPGPQGKYTPVSQLGGLSSACDSPLLPAYPLGVGSNSSARFAGEEMGRERTHSFSHLQDVLNSLNRWQITI